MLPYHRKLLSAVGNGGFYADAVTFDGSNDYLNRGADLTGNVDGKQFILSFWVNFNSDDSVTDVIYKSNNTKIQIIREGDSKDITFTAKNTSKHTQHLSLIHI